MLKKVFEMCKLTCVCYMPICVAEVYSLSLLYKILLYERTTVASLAHYTWSSGLFLLLLIRHKAIMNILARVSCRI